MSCCGGVPRCPGCCRRCRASASAAACEDRPSASWTRATHMVSTRRSMGGWCSSGAGSSSPSAGSSSTSCSSASGGGELADMGSWSGGGRQGAAAAAPSVGSTAPADVTGPHPPLRPSVHLYGEAEEGALAHAVHAHLHLRAGRQRHPHVLPRLLLQRQQAVVLCTNVNLQQRTKGDGVGWWTRTARGQQRRRRHPRQLQQQQRQQRQP
mgnify:CR=1 FL=1